MNFEDNIFTFNALVYVWFAAYVIVLNSFLLLIALTVTTALVIALPFYYKESLENERMHKCSISTFKQVSIQSKGD